MQKASSICTGLLLLQSGSRILFVCRKAFGENDSAPRPLADFLAITHNIRSQCLGIRISGFISLLSALLVDMDFPIAGVTRAKDDLSRGSLDLRFYVLRDRLIILEELHHGAGDPGELAHLEGETVTVSPWTRSSADCGKTCSRFSGIHNPFR